MALFPSEEPPIGMETASTRPDIRHDLPCKDTQAFGDGNTHGVHVNNDSVADSSDSGSFHLS
jgi:hypothetical protein